MALRFLDKAANPAHLVVCLTGKIDLETNVNLMIFQKSDKQIGDQRKFC
jgi:hypothetical protein